jgi:hypothetical protein
MSELMVNPVRRVLQNLFLAASSVAIALLILELISRLIIEPVNFLRPELVDDPILGHVITPHSGGHDAWGFRNYTLPATAKIVTIGDSQTYGASAAAKDSWPSLLKELSKQSVYNTLKAFFEDHRIAYPNLLPQMQEQLTRAQLYPGNFDGHPNKNGYRVIAESIERYLRKLAPKAAGSD